MPELPEVETVARTLQRLVGARCSEARSDHSARFGEAEGLAGHTVETVRRRGKYLLLDLDDAHCCIIHLGMSGVVSLTSPPEAPLPDPPHLRASWVFEAADGEVLHCSLVDPRGFGRCALRRLDAPGALAGMPGLAALGPEPLEGEFTPRALHAALQRSTAPVKALLLSQRPVAGLGNIYVDEALWAAGIHPATPASKISLRRAARLHEAIRAAIRAGIEHGGTTLRDYRDAEGGRGSHQDHLHAYGRGGLPCLGCSRPLSTSQVAGRTSVWCARCQRR